MFEEMHNVTIKTEIEDNQSSDLDPGEGDIPNKKTRYSEDTIKEERLEFVDVNALKDGFSKKSGRNSTEKTLQHRESEKERVAGKMTEKSKKPIEEKQNSQKKGEKQQKATFLTLGQRQEIMKFFKNNESANVKINVSELAKKFNVSLSTIQRLKRLSKNSKNSTEQIDKSSYLYTRKRGTTSKNPLLEDILYDWFKEKKCTGQPVTMPIIKEKALIINKEINGDPKFKASNGWFCRFKDRFQIHSCAIQEETVSNDWESSEEFVDELAALIRNQNLDLHQIYNADETGLFWRTLPSVDFVSDFEKSTASGKVLEDRVTVMVCANADGSHKIPLFVIGKSKNPRCFKGVNKVPVTYAVQENAWMSRELYEEWITKVFLPSVREFQSTKGNTSQKVMLIVDNAPCHLSKEDTEVIDDMIIVQNLPDNITGLTQPMEQGVIEKIKNLYRKNFLREMLLEKNKEGVIEFLKQRSLLNCCVQISSVWSEVTSINICRAWRKLIPGCDINISNCKEVTEEDILQILYRIPGFQNVTSEQVSTWLKIDKFEPGWNIENLGQIIPRFLGCEIKKENCKRETDEPSETDGEDTENYEILEEGSSVDNIVTDAIEAYNGLKVFKSWFEQRCECKSENLIQLQKFQEITKDVLSMLKDLHISEDSDNE